MTLVDGYVSSAVITNWLMCDVVSGTAKEEDKFGTLRDAPSVNSWFCMLHVFACRVTENEKREL